MGFKLSSAITIARGVLNDTETPYRYSTEDLIEYGNGCIRALPGIKPEWLYTEGEVSCVQGQALQSVSYDDAHSLADVLRIKGGAAVLPCAKKALDAFSPSWEAGTPGAAKNWMPSGNDPVRFYVSPPAPANQVLIVFYVRIPGPYTSDEDTGLPITITEAVADYIVGMAESRDDEHVNAARATQFLNQFAARLGAKPQG